MFIGRRSELEQLRQKNWRDGAELTVVYGRRRVGKTALVEEAYKDQVLWRFDGIEGASQQQQLRHFADQLGLYAPNTVETRIQPFANWSQALEALARGLNAQKDAAIVIFLDEFQWMARMRTKLVSLFKSYWDLHFSRHPNHRFVLCGSVSSFMVKKVIRSRALYGRVSTEINLQPLSIGEIYTFFQDRRSREEVIEIAMCFGGVPQYLREMNPDYSLMQNLNEYALRPNGFFFGEFQRIFISHFGKNRAYETILNTLSRGPHTIPQLVSACRTQAGGTFTNILHDLELAGFIERYTPLGKGKTSRQVRYRIHDEYLHFYFRFLRDHQQDILTGKYDTAALPLSRAFTQWQGYAFERLCRRHARCIADALRFSGIQYRVGAMFEPGNSPSQGHQIDLAFDRADRVLTVCEMKYTDSLQGKAAVDRFERTCQQLVTRYPRRGLQKVLVSGKHVELPQAVKQYFDRILYATDIFFD